MYHEVRFEQEHEGMAFLAALSRFLNYPQGQPYLSREVPLEVWFHTLSENAGLSIYLSESALEAAAIAFSPVPTSSTVSAANLPLGCKLLFAGKPPAWGVLDVQHQL